VSQLVVFREQALYRSIELGRRGITIGRGAQNDLVLDDPEKVVSRFHAELRPTGDGYVLIDLNSQNGTWVDERRVDRVALRAGQPVAIGPYRLVLDEAPGPR
jgi:pSer/pThr/pTyr-binding forkhead associated (FHA) protein